MASAPAWPTELRLKERGRLLSITFDDGASFDLPAEYLRVESPSAEVQGHSAAERKTLGGKARVAVTKILPTGNYAVRLVFDDAHESGIFTWSYLRELGEQHPTRWRTYLARLAEKGLSRE